ncbi:MAG: MFS transporter [Pseudomonadota bacterium]
MTQIPTETEPSSQVHESPHGQPEDTVKRNYVIFVTQGVIVQASKKIGNANLLLPYLYVSTGAPVFLAGMLLPILAGSRLIGQYVGAPIMSAASTRRWFLVGGWGATAIALAVAALSASVPNHVIVMAIFVAVAVTMGATKGLNALAFNDLLARLFDRSRRNSGLFLMTAAGGAVTIAVSWLMHRISSGSNTLDHNVNLALGAAAVTGLAALLMMTFREPKDMAVQHWQDASTDSTGKGAKPTVSARLKKFREVLQFQWFRSYLIMRCFTATVIVAMPFYAVHGATHHVGTNPGGLSAFVVATSVAVIIFGPIWKRISQRSQRYTLALGSFFVAGAGVWALTITEVTPTHSILAHCLVFALAAAGIQGVNASRMLFLIDASSEEELPYLVAVSTSVAAVLQLILSSIFGYIAQLQGVHWPVILLVVLNIIAAGYSLSLNEPKVDEK